MNVSVKISYRFNVNVDGADVAVVLSDAMICKDCELLTFVLKMTGIGDDIISAVDFDTLRFYDRKGLLPFYSKDEPRSPRVMRKFFASRASEGEIRLSYSCKFRSARRNPILDMGIEKNGTMGAGENFLPSFPSEKVCLTLDADLSSLPDSFFHAWTYGNIGELEVGGDVLSTSYFCVGKINRYERDLFGYYWLDDSLDLSETAQMAENIFSRFSSFFGKANGPYRIFARCRETSVCGGTAADRSYAYIYAPQNHPSKEELKLLFAHEIAHNWTTMSDSPYGVCTWYQEGVADLYSTLLLHRFGMLSRDELIYDLNSKSAQYYENPCIDLPNEELGKLLFKDLEATTVPYGRGFFYLLQTDHDIRTATNGKYSLDDIIHRLLSLEHRPDNESWLKALEDIGVCDAREKFESMCSGSVIEPILQCFENADIKITQKTGVRRRTGDPCKLWVFE